MAWGNARSRTNASSSSSSSQFRGRNWAAATNKHDDDGGGGSQSKLKGLKSSSSRGGDSIVQFLLRSKSLPLWFAIVCCVGLVLYVRPQISPLHHHSSHLHHRENTEYNYHSEKEHEVDLRRAVTKNNNNNNKEEDDDDGEEDLGESSKKHASTAKAAAAKAQKIVREKSSAGGNSGGDEETTKKKIAAAGGTITANTAGANKKSAKCQAQLDGARTFYSGVSNVLPVCNSLRQKPVFDFDGELNDAPTVKFGKAVKVFSLNETYRYAHMVTAAALPNDVIVAAFQAAPSLQMENGQTKFAVEGLPDQIILYSVSKDGGKSWSGSKRAPVGNEGRAVWAPVLHYDEKAKKLMLFYAASELCVKYYAKPVPRSDPGGHIKMIEIDNFGEDGKFVDEGAWSAPKMVYEQKRGEMPYLIANKPIKASNGDLILPFWQEYNFKYESSDSANPNDDEDDSNSDNSNNAGACVTRSYAEGECPPDRETISGVLISSDNGKTWTKKGDIRHPKTSLLEGAIAEIPALPQGSDEPQPALTMLFRTDCGCVFRSMSFDFGATWSDPHPSPGNLPNVNTKLDMTSLYPTGHLAMAFNNHRRWEHIGSKEHPCKLCRTHLHFALSSNGGEDWTTVAAFDDLVQPDVRIHYPSILPLGRGDNVRDDRVLVLYSKFFLGKCKESEKGQSPLICPGFNDPTQGILARRVDTHLLFLGNLSPLTAKTTVKGTPEDPHSRPDPSDTVSLTVLRQFLTWWKEKNVPADYPATKMKPDALQEGRGFVRIKTMRRKNIASRFWDKVVDSLHDRFDLRRVGGSAFYRRHKRLMNEFSSMADDVLAVLGVDKKPGADGADGGEESEEGK